MANMSWKRIFKTARKVGAPVIVADEDGKRAQVIISLDKYERLMEDAYDFEIPYDDFEVDRVPEFEFDEEDFDDEMPDFDDVEEVDDIPEFESGVESAADDINEAELYHQYRKRRDEGYTSGEIMNQLENEGFFESDSKTLPPDEKALSAFEVDEELEKANKEVMDMSAEGETDRFEPPSDDEQVSREKISQPSEEMDMEDRFYFEPIEDDGNKA